ncbi:MAG: hypothetical protein KGZ86_00850 [Candidatus Latescibacteria bacterium]|nr:hypothetical protein [Candidatus Latescibacterota bacterium]
MAKTSTCSASYEAERWFPSKWVLSISYGKCETPEYAEKGLWFVTIPEGIYDDLKREGKNIDELIAEGYMLEKLFPQQDMTFLVAEEHAQPSVIKKLRRDIKAWADIAHKYFSGDWCAEQERPWKDVPVYIHTLPDGQEFKYGYCRTTKNDRPLWYVCFQSEGSDHTFILDEVCASPEFINHLGADYRKWLPLCWCYLEDEAKAGWDDLQTGADAKWFRQYSLDSPYSIEQINHKIAVYREEMKNQNL